MMKLRLITMKDRPSAAKQAAWGRTGAATWVLSVRQQRPNQHMNGGRWEPYQDLRSGAQGFPFFGNNTDIEDSRKNEDEARSWGGSWKDGKKKEQKLLKNNTTEVKPEETEINRAWRLVLKHQCISCFGTFKNKACELCGSTHLLPINEVCPKRKKCHFTDDL